MLRLELREAVQLLYNNTGMRVSEFEHNKEHHLTCFWVSKGATQHIHGSVRKITDISDHLRAQHRQDFYNEIVDIHGRG